jgi:16S rRNA (guanine527-N7)-methyltransferase
MPGELGVFGVDDDSPLYRQLPLYLAELQSWNRKMNLTGPDRGDFRERHVNDCLAAYPVIRSLKPETVADVGTGAGLPGLLLAMVMPESNVLLIEKSPKKCGFLRHVVSVCGMGNVRIYNGRVGELSEKVDLVTFRAVSPLDPEFVGELKGLCGPATRVVAYKGRREKINSELESIKGLIGKIEILPLTVPGLSEERHLVLFSMS